MYLCTGLESTASDLGFGNQALGASGWLENAGLRGFALLGFPNIISIYKSVKG